MLNPPQPRDVPPVSSTHLSPWILLAHAVDGKTVTSGGIALANHLAGSIILNRLTPTASSTLSSTRLLVHSPDLVTLALISFRAHGYSRLDNTVVVQFTDEAPPSPRLGERANSTVFAPLTITPLVPLFWAIYPYVSFKKPGVGITNRVLRYQPWSRVTLGQYLGTGHHRV